MDDVLEHLSCLPRLHTIRTFDSSGLYSGDLNLNFAVNCFSEISSLQVFQCHTGRVWLRGAPMESVYQVGFDDDLWEYWTEDWLMTQSDVFDILSRSE